MTGSTVVGTSLSKSRLASPYAPMFVSSVSMLTTCVEVYEHAQVSLSSVVYGQSNCVMIWLGTFLYIDGQPQRETVVKTIHCLDSSTLAGNCYTRAELYDVIGCCLSSNSSRGRFVAVDDGLFPMFFALGLWNYLVTMIARSAVTHGYGMVWLDHH